MPVERHWALRGGFAPRANPRRPHAHSPPQDSYSRSVGDLFVSFYHRSQESAKMCEAMKRRTELAYEQRRKSEASRLQKISNGCVVRYLERVPLTRNVTLTIEIPNIEHAGMIERMEAWCEDSIPQIMHDTGVLIQFPDLVLDVKNANDYINRVTLTGPLANVEEARIRIRNFMPVAVTFPLRTLKSGIEPNEVKGVIEQAIANKVINFPNIEIMVQLSQTSHDLTCVVRGALSRERDICDACTALHRLLFDAANENEHSSAMIYTTIMDIPAVQQLAVTGMPDGFLIRLISVETNAVIYFPTVADRHFGATVFYLYGTVHAILQARKYIQGLLPVRLIFDVENSDLLSPVDTSNRELYLRDTERDLAIMIKKSRLEGEKLTASDTLRNVVTIESEEYNLTNVYAARQKLFRNGVLSNEPVIVTSDFDFFERDFRGLIAKNNQVIAESAITNDSLLKAQSLLNSKLPQYRRSNVMSPMAMASSSMTSEVPDLVPRLQNSQEVIQPPALENKQPIGVTVDLNLINQTGRISKEAITYSAPPPPPSVIVPKEQKTSEVLNISVPQFLELFKPRDENSNNNIVMIPIDSTGAPVRRKTESNRNSNDKTAPGHNTSDESSEARNFTVVGISANETIHDSMNSISGCTVNENIPGTKCFPEKLPVCARSFSVAARPHSLMTSGTNVVDALINDQGSTTVAVAAAMLQNSPPQWFQSAGTMAALKSGDYFGRMPQIVETKTAPETSTKPSDGAKSSRDSTPEKNWKTKKTLPLKASFIKENYGREYHRDTGTDGSYSKNDNTSPGLPVRDSKEESSDVRLSPLSNSRNSVTPYSYSRGGSMQNFGNRYRTRQNNDNNTGFRGYRSERQPMRSRDGGQWENWRRPPPLFDSRPNTRQVLSRRYQGRFGHNSLRPEMRGGRTIRHSSMNQSGGGGGGYYSTYSRSHSPWSLSSFGNNDGRRYGNRTGTHLHMKRQFVNGSHMDEKGKGDRREDRMHPPTFQQEQQHSRGVYDEKHEDGAFNKEHEGSNDEPTPSPAPSDKTKTYADIMKRVDVMTLIDEVQKSEAEQAARNAQQQQQPQMNRPPLMMKELEKYTGNDRPNSRSYADMAKKSTVEDDQIQNRTLAQNQITNEK